MLARSLGKLEHQDFGFKTENRVMVTLNSPPATYTSRRLNSIYRELEGQLKAMPGVEQEGLALLQSAHQQLGRTDSCRRASAAEAG